jgi:Tol biopolymer transport system component
VLHPRFSADGRRVVVSSGERAGGYDLWMIDVERGVRSRLTFENSARTPIWTPDGKHITYQTQPEGSTTTIQQRSATGLGAAQELQSQRAGIVPNSWSPDGRSLVYMNFVGGQGPRLWLYDAVEKQSRSLLGTRFNESAAAVSPDGKWMAYVSDETGREEVYVVTFPSIDGKWQVSTAGGSQPRWMPDGKSILYVTSDGAVMRARVRPAEAFAVDAPQKLLETRIRGAGGRTLPQYDISPDGRRVILVSDLEEEHISLTLTVNWRAALQK